MKTKLGRQLEAGDRVILDEGGKPVTITATANGIYRNSRLIRWRGGEGHAWNNTAYEIAESKQVEKGKQG